MNDKKLTRDEIKRQIKAGNTAIANEMAVKYGYTDAAEAIRSISEDLKSGSAMVKDDAQKVAIDFTKQLILLCLYQNIENPLIDTYIGAVGNKFDAGNMTEGNTMEFIVNLLTGSEQYDINAFIPKGLTLPQVLETTANMLIKETTGEIVLGPNSYRFFKPLTITAEKWLTFFMSGKLSDFIAKISELIIKSYVVYKFNKVALLITSMVPSTKIVGKAANMFDAFSKEIFPLVADMLLFNEKYSYNSKNYALPTELNVSDLVMVISQKVKTMLTTGIQSQLFNAKMLDLDALIASGNIIVLGDKIVYPENDAGTRVSCSDVPYVDDFTVIIFEKSLIKHIGQVNRNESQAFATNLTIQLILHVWGTFAYIPWKKAVIYTNPNLTKLPGEVAEVVEVAEVTA